MIATELVNLRTGWAMTLIALRMIGVERAILFVLILATSLVI